VLSGRPSIEKLTIPSGAESKLEHRLPPDYHVASPFLCSKSEWKKEFSTNFLDNCRWIVVENWNDRCAARYSIQKETISLGFPAGGRQISGDPGRSARAWTIYGQIFSCGKYGNARFSTGA